MRASPNCGWGRSYPGSANRLQGLRDVMAMHREGLLDAEEFKAAKRALLGLCATGRFRGLDLTTTV